MLNYNSQIQSNNTDLQQVLQTLQTKATAGQATPEISVSSNGLITATAGTKSSMHQLAFQPAKTVTPGTASQIAVSSGYFTGGKVMVAGDANLVAGNIKSGVSIFGVSGTLIEGGGSGEAAEWSESEDAIVTRTLSSYFNNRVTSIGQGAFADAQNLKSVDFPNVKTIGSYAFSGCSSLTTVSFPACTTIDKSAFFNCFSLTAASFPACVTIGSYAFWFCSSMTTASFPACTSISMYAFCNCSKLTTVSFPACATIGSSAFNQCDNLTIVSFPVCTSISMYAFELCSNLTTVSFPACTTIGGSAFGLCSKLTTVSFPACTTIGISAFIRCYRLQSLYLVNSSVCKLSHSNAFSYTPYAGYKSYFSGTPYIYVPASLVSAYQTATNWTYYSSYFSAIESLGGSAN
jgi:hypothetical protein